MLSSPAITVAATSICNHLLIHWTCNDPDVVILTNIGVQVQIQTNICIPRAGHHPSFLGSKAHGQFGEDTLCQGASETRNVLCPSTHRALTYLQNGHSRG